MFLPCWSKEEGVYSGYPVILDPGRSDCSDIKQGACRMVDTKNVINEGRAEKSDSATPTASPAARGGAGGGWLDLCLAGSSLLLGRTAGRRWDGAPPSATPARGTGARCVGWLDRSPTVNSRARRAGGGMAHLPPLLQRVAWARGRWRGERARGGWALKI